MHGDLWNAEDYARHSDAQLKWAEELVRGLRLAGSEHILDIGCGDGKVTRILAEKVPYGKVTGIDSSPDMIRVASRNFPEQLFPNLRFTVLDARDMAFESCFDLVFSNAAMHWIKDHGPALQRIRTGLKSGGRLVIQMGGKGNAAGILRVMDRMIALDPWGAYFQGFVFPYGFYGVEEYRRLLDQAGFIPLRISLIPKTMEKKTREDLESDSERIPGACPGVSVHT